MAKLKWKTGDRVQIVDREVTRDDKQAGTYFRHMAGLTGTVQNFYGEDEVAVTIDADGFTDVMAHTQKEAVKRMRAKFLDSLGEEQKRRLTKEEKRFDAGYVILVHSADLVKGPAASKAVRADDSDAEDDDLETFDPTSVRQDALYDDPEVPDAPRRRTLEDMENDERAELDRRKN